MPRAPRTLREISSDGLAAAAPAPPSGALAADSRSGPRAGGWREQWRFESLEGMTVNDGAMLTIDPTKTFMAKNRMTSYDEFGFA
jgi:hypothetical protein